MNAQPLPTAVPHSAPRSGQAEYRTQQWFRGRLGFAASSVWNILADAAELSPDGIAHVPIGALEPSKGRGMTGRVSGLTPRMCERALRKLRRLRVIQDAGWRMRWVLEDRRRVWREVYCRRVIVRKVGMGQWGPQVSGPAKVIQEVEMACGQGGRRAGAGRPKGARNRPKNGAELISKGGPCSEKPNDLIPPLNPPKLISKGGTDLLREEIRSGSDLVFSGKNSVSPEGGAAGAAPPGGVCFESREETASGEIPGWSSRQVDSAGRAPGLRHELLVPAGYAGERTVSTPRPPLLDPHGTPAEHVRYVLRVLNGAVVAAYGDQARPYWCKQPVPQALTGPAARKLARRKPAEGWATVAKWCELAISADVRPAEWIAFRLSWWKAKFPPSVGRRAPQPTLKLLFGADKFAEHMGWFESVREDLLLRYSQQVPAAAMLWSLRQKACAAVRWLPANTPPEVVRAKSAEFLSDARRQKLASKIPVQMREQRELLLGQVARGEWLWGAL